MAAHGRTAGLNVTDGSEQIGGWRLFQQSSGRVVFDDGDGDAHLNVLRIAIMPARSGIGHRHNWGCHGFDSHAHFYSCAAAVMTKDSTFASDRSQALFQIVQAMSSDDALAMTDGVSISCR